MLDDRHRPDRRRFLARASAWATIAALHPWLAPGGSAHAAIAAPPRRSTPLIREIRLRTAAPLDEMKAFYAGTMGLPVEADDEGLAVRAGVSRLVFTPAGTGEPFYHFAFNIPQNKIRAARDWQRERTPLIAVPERLHDPRFPDDVVHFRNWNAHSVFFLDPAGNVLEHIARHDLDNASRGPFTSKELLCTSEIALVADDVPAMAAGIRGTFDLPRYKNESAAFSAVGDEQGLLLVFRRGRSLGFDAKPPRLADVQPAQVRIDGAPSGRWSAGGYRIER